MYRTDGTARSHYLRYGDWLKHQPADRLTQKRAEVDALFHRVGITFAVYGQEEGAERLIPFDIVPRVDAAPVRGVRHGGGGESMEAAVMVAESVQQQQ